MDFIENVSTYAPSSTLERETAKMLNILVTYYIEEYLSSWEADLSVNLELFSTYANEIKDKPEKYKTGPNGGVICVCKATKGGDVDTKLTLKKFVPSNTATKIRMMFILRSLIHELEASEGSRRKPVKTELLNNFMESIAVSPFLIGLNEKYMCDYDLGTYRENIKKDIKKFKDKNKKDVENAAKAKQTGEDVADVTEFDLSQQSIDCAAELYGTFVLRYAKYLAANLWGKITAPRYDSNRKEVILSPKDMTVNSGLTIDSSGLLIAFITHMSNDVLKDDYVLKSDYISNMICYEINTHRKVSKKLNGDSNSEHTDPNADDH